MRSRLSIILCGFACFLLFAEPVLAQGAGFNRNLWNRSPASARPAVSPYLNLLRPGGGFAQNYYGLVRPEQQFRAGIAGLQEDLQAVNTAMSRMNVADTGVHETGHHAGFMTHAGNFMSLGAGAGGSQRSGAGRSSQIPSTRPSSGRGGHH